MCGLGGAGVKRSWLFGDEWGVGRRSVGWRPPESGETDTNPTEIASAPGLARQSNPQRLLWHPLAAGRQRLPRNLPTISPAPIVLRGSAAWPAPWSDGTVPASPMDLPRSSRTSSNEPDAPPSDPAASTTTASGRCSTPGNPTGTSSTPSPPTEIRSAPSRAIPHGYESDDASSQNCEAQNHRDRRLAAR